MVSLSLSLSAKTLFLFLFYDIIGWNEKESAQTRNVIRQAEGHWQGRLAARRGMAHHHHASYGAL